MQCETLEIKIPFSGFYYSFHDANFDHWLEYEQENAAQEYDASDEQLEKMSSLFFDRIDWRKAHTAYARDYADAFESFIMREFDAAPLALKFKALESPREYNFETDKIFCEITRRTLESLLLATDEKVLRETIRARCSHRSGFISFYPNELEEWPQDLSEFDHNHAAIVLEAYLVTVGGEQWDSDIDWQIMEDHSGNGGLDDNISEAVDSAFWDEFDAARRAGKAA